MAIRTFSTPAFVNDFPNDSTKQQKLAADWSTNIERWTQTAILGDPWDVLYDHNRVGYYDPTKTDATNVSAPAPITWNAFPARLQHYFGDKGQEYLWNLADNGNVPNIPDGNGGTTPYTPAGFRGWQDEYCEWSVTRNGDGKITRVDCSCENSEYWLTLWRVDPKRVLELYQQLVGSQVTLDDLTLKGRGGDVVIDPSTGTAAYDPLNKYNNSTTNGVVHLVSGPNTLGAEIYLGAAATIMRDGQDGRDPDSLIKCAKYGREYRNSDPTIGATVYGLARAGNRMTLTDPVGLYMSVSDANAGRITRKVGHGSQQVNCFTVIRGTTEMNRGLHIRFEVPADLASQGVTLSDLMVDGIPVQYGAQLVQLITMTLYGEGYGPYTPRPAQPCVADAPNPTPMVQAFLPTQIYTYQWVDRSLQVALTPRVTHPAVDGSTKPIPFTLCAGYMQKGATLVFSEPFLQVVVDWNSYRWSDTDETGTVELTIFANAFTQLGDVSLQIVNPDGRRGPPLPSVLEIVDRPKTGAIVTADDATQTSLTAVRANKSRPRRR